MGDTQHQPGAPFSQLDSPVASASASFPVSLATGQPQIPVGSSGPYPPTHALAFGPQQGQKQQYGPPHGLAQHAFTSQLELAQPQIPPRAGPFDMSTMANALPQPNYRPGPSPGGPYGRGQQRYHPMPNPSPAMVGQLPTSPFADQNTMAMMPNQHQQYYLPQHAPVAHYYANGVVVGQQPHPGAQYYYPQTAHFAAQPPPIQPQLVSSQQYIPPVLHQADARLSPSHTTGQAVNMGFVADQNATEGRPSIVRGPPRKPRQSGHAIWIGNLPPQTDLMSLVHHVCKEAEGLESLFLISKSNCAFANFKDEEACIAAQKQLHDSKFQSVRLVSRLRKSTVESAAGVTAPTGPAASTPPTAPVQESDTSNAWEGEGEGEGGEHVAGGPAADEFKTTASANEGGGGPAPKDRFFILKSLTVEDLELSVRTGIWATQSHNEDNLNSAFASSDNVYLVFSANKSGEYFGFARMTSPINDDPAAAIQFAPAAPTSSDVELPKAIPTDATEFAPKGRIIDDSARGTIFWEVEREDRASGGSSNGDDGPAGGETGSVKSGDEGTGAGDDTKAWGKPFRLEWLSTARLPFYRTRGLRNPWNSNREVKIARDGTELQPAVGRRLIGLFNRVQSPVPHVPGVLGGGGIQGSAVPTVGFPPMRPAY